MWLIGAMVVDETSKGYHSLLQWHRWRKLFILINRWIILYLIEAILPHKED